MIAIYEIILILFAVGERFFKKVSNKLIIKVGFTKNRNLVNNFRVGKQ